MNIICALSRLNLDNNLLLLTGFPRPLILIEIMFILPTPLMTCAICSNHPLRVEKTKNNITTHKTKSDQELVTPNQLERAISPRDPVGRSRVQTSIKGGPYKKFEN